MRLRVVPGWRAVLGGGDRQAGNGADDDPEHDVAQPSPDADAKAAAEGNPGVDRPLARRRWMAAASMSIPLSLNRLDGPRRSLRID
ncbi:MAG TPA: hypothetical protein VFN05_07375, partial [Actinomycetes bacterium]|nr:hypothetical protein [Actinomycetes bacterium]